MKPTQYRNSHAELKMLLRNLYETQRYMGLDVPQEVRMDLLDIILPQEGDSPKKKIPWQILMEIIISFTGPINGEKLGYSTYRKHAILEIDPKDLDEVSFQNYLGSIEALSEEDLVEVAERRPGDLQYHVFEAIEKNIDYRLERFSFNHLIRLHRLNSERTERMFRKAGKRYPMGSPQLAGAS